MTERHVTAARVRGLKRTDEIWRKIISIMSVISEELKNNDGIYPNNGGVLSKNEVARRAGIGKTTLFSAAQKELNCKVDLWLDGLKNSTLPPRSVAKGKYLQRLDAWKAKYDALENSHRKTELDLQTLEAEHEKLLSKLADMRVIIDGLRSAEKLLTSANILYLPSDKHK
ncbi:hypothetical protein [Pseudomonas sp. S2_H01]